jgi:hypothetical protein
VQLLDEALEIGRVTAAEQVALAAFLEACGRVLADRLEHAHPGCAAARAFGDHEAVLDEALERAEDVLDLLVAAHRFRRGDRPPAREDGESREERALGLVEELVAPLDRRRQRSLAIGEVRNASADDVQPPREPFQKRPRIEHAQPGGRQLDRQR